MTDEPAETPKCDANENPWYRLATLYGEPASDDHELQARNRVAWNRFMAGRLTGEARAKLMETGRYSAEELRPLMPDELRELENALRERSRSLSGVTLPPLEERIDFSGVQFRDFFASDFLFTDDVTFSNTSFSGRAEFNRATFSREGDFTGTAFTEWAGFNSATFSGRAGFQSATFSEQTDFNRAVFSGGANFDGATFSGWAEFNRATFSGWAGFRSTAFSGGTVFILALFSGRAWFNEAKFSGWTEFDQATFSGIVRFNRATFSGGVRFNRATFSERAGFEGVTFARAEFNGVTFSEQTRFNRATFSEGAEFEGVIFSRGAEFIEAIFSGPVGFYEATFAGETWFINAEMEGETLFERATFKTAPPRLFGAKLHEGTVWLDVKWPSAPKDKGEAGRFMAAYERLKLEMDRLKKHEDELDFFARELQSRRVLHGDWEPISFKIFGRTIMLYRPTSGLGIWLYGFLCDFGRSYVRPLCGLLLTAAIGTLVFWSHLGWFKIKKGSGLSLANTFGVLGFRKDFISPQLVEALPGLLKLVAAAQTVLGAVLLFLFGLALRNRFRMK